MVQMKSLRTEILERLNLQKGGETTARRNVAKATKDFKTSKAPQFRGKSPEKRQKMAVAAGLSAARGESAAPKAGDKMIYEGKAIVVKTINESGMAVVRFGNHREVIVRAADLKAVEKEQLTEGFIGIAAIGPTYREPTDYGFIKLTGLDPEDIGLRLYEEDDDEVESDDQEENTDNGSNIRSDGHTGKKEVDELPTPSDTIAPAYSSEIPPKVISEPLSTHVGAEESELWKAPEWDGYDYPADAPEIPTADFEREEMGNARAPHFSSDDQKPDWSQKNPFAKKKDSKKDSKDSKKDDDERTDESDRGMGSNYHDDPYSRDEDRERRRRLRGMNHELGDYRERMLAKSAREDDDNRGRVKASVARMKGKVPYRENFEFVREMDDMLGHEGHEPRQGDTITVTLPAMASILCTVAHKVQGDRTLLKAMVEALCEIGQGSNSGCIDMPDLDAVAAHMNGEETQEIENRDAGNPDHEGTDMQGEQGEHGDEQHGPADMWAGDGEKSRTGKTKLMGGVAEEAQDYFGSDDVVAETIRLTDDEELRMIKRRAGLKFW